MKDYLLTKRPAIAICLILFLLFLSCEKIDNNAWPYLSYKDSLDMDGDLRFDFVVEYSTIVSTDFPSSSQLTSGSLRPLKGNQVLYRYPEGCLFLQENDTVKIEQNTNAVWSAYAAVLIHTGCSDGRCDKEWTIISGNEDDFFAGIKIPGEPERIGWILFEFNTADGKITVLNKALSDSTEVLIKK